MTLSVISMQHIFSISAFSKKNQCEDRIFILAETINRQKDAV